MSDALVQLQRALLTTPDQMASLWRTPDVAAFCDQAARIAGAGGLTVSAAEVRAALSPGTPGRERLTIDPAALPAGWIPYRVSAGAWMHGVAWLYAADAAFTAPFVEADFRRLAEHPLNRLLAIRCDLADLSRITPAHHPVDGLIFHISRCGSTLAARMLAATGAMVLSEPQPISGVLRAHTLTDAPQADRRAWLAGVLAAYRRAAGDRRLVIKLDAYSLLDFRDLMAACDGAPMAVVHRDPVEVLVSHQSMRGAQSVAGMIEWPLPGFSPDHAMALSEDEYTAAFLAALCEAGAKVAAAGGQVVAYQHLPDALLDPRRPFLGLAMSDAELAVMRDASLVNAKQPGRTFQPDRRDKQAAADAALRALASRVVAPSWVRLAQGARQADGATVPPGRDAEP